MLDADRTTIRKTHLDRLYCEELSKARSISSRLSRAVQAGPVWACDASVYDCIGACEGNAFLVGDAASFVEALSSGGVKKALSSAWTASVVVNTCLGRPSMRRPASELYQRRERQVFGEYARRSAEFFREAALAYGDPFWTTRAAFGNSMAADDSGPSDFDLERDPAMKLVFDELRERTRLGFVPGPQLKLGDAAVIEDREVVLREGVVVAGFDAPLRFTAGVNLPALIQLAPGCQDLPSLAEAYERRVAPVHPRDLLVGLSFLITRGALSLASYPGDRRE
jgi:hypothetical protein